jgi:Holliday junction resolvasome RuvABC endonuclease subunit
MENVKILGFDCATRTGWANSSGACGAFELGKGAPSTGMVPRGSFILAAAMREYGRLMDEYGPTVIAIEAPFSRGLGTRLLYGLAGMVQALAGSRGLPVVYMEPSQVRKIALGRGNADKDDVLAWARGNGHILTDKQTDEADALLVVEAARIASENGGIVKKKKPVKRTPKIAAGMTDLFAEIVSPKLLTVSKRKKA